MQSFIDKITGSFVEFFNTLDLGKKFALVGLFAGIVGTTFSIGLWATKTRYSPLYSDLNQEDSKKIAIVLEENNISYQTSNDGKMISIPEEMVEVWRLKLAMQGTNFSGTLGYEIFDKQSFGTTNLVQKINKQRALEGELVRTIKYIKGIKRARVHLAIPESSPFVIEKKSPEASVVIELDDGVVLNEDEVRGIGHLVSSSVDGMRPEHVVILDHRGKRLSENVGDVMTAQTANRMALEQKMNHKMEKQVEDILGKVVGMGKVIAKVSVNIDFTEKMATETKFDSENSVVLSEVNNSHNVNAVPTGQGAPGASSNLPGEISVALDKSKDRVNKELSTKNYNVPSKVVQSKTPTSGIEKISVAVMVDGKKVPILNAQGVARTDANGKAIKKYEAWSQSDIENFKAIVASAIGLNEARGDKIVVKNMEFAQEDFSLSEAVIQERESRELMKNIVKYLAIGLGITLFFVFVVRPFVQWVTDNTIETVEEFLPKTIEELEGLQADKDLPGLENIIPKVEEKLNPEKVEGNMLREKIIAMVEDNPAKAAQILSEMIHSQGSDKEIA